MVRGSYHNVPQPHCANPVAQLPRFAGLTKAAAAPWCWLVESPTFSNFDNIARPLSAATEVTKHRSGSMFGHCIQAAVATATTQFRNIQQRPHHCRKRYNQALQQSLGRDFDACGCVCNGSTPGHVISWMPKKRCKCMCCSGRIIGSILSSDMLSPYSQPRSTICIVLGHTGPRQLAWKHKAKLAK